MNARIVFAALAALVILRGVAAQDRNSYYWSNDEQVRVVVDPTLVALRFSIDPAQSLIDSVGREHGLTERRDASYAPLRGNRTVVFSVNGVTQITNRYLATLQNQLTQSGAPVADVSRVVTRATGSVAAMPQQLSVAFIDDVKNGLSDFPGLDVANLVTVTQVLNPTPLVVAYTVNANTELTALEIANAIYEYRDAAGRRLVRYAQSELRFPAGFRAVPNVPRNPNDMHYMKQWHLNGGPSGNVDAPEAWDYTRGSPDQPTSGCQVPNRIRVAVLDNGFEVTHLDLVDNIAEGGDYTTLIPGTDVSPSSSDTGRRHGTQAAGVVAACGNNTIGVSGICPLCEIVPIKIDPFLVGPTVGALLATKNRFDVDVVSNSWSAVWSQPLETALDLITGTTAAGPGTPVFFAVPNQPTKDRCVDGTEVGGVVLDRDISAADSVIAVSGSLANDVAGGVGSLGNCIDVVAPTQVTEFDDLPFGMVVTTDLTEFLTYTTLSNGFGGTSAAAPLVAGIAGLVLSLNPDLTPEDVRNILEHTAEKIMTPGLYDAKGFNPAAGYGRVNAHRAVVPVVKITTTATPVIQPNQPFDITVSASAPHLLASIGWSRRKQGCLGSVEDWRAVADKAFHEETWSGVSLDTPGTYFFRPNAKDTKFPATDDYPHIASDASLVLPEVEIRVQGIVPPCLVSPPQLIPKPPVLDIPQ